MANTYRLFNDTSELETVQINDTVLARYLFTSDGGYNLSNIVNGVNRINFYCKESGTYKVRLNQYLGSIDTNGEIQNFMNSAFHTGSVLLAFETFANAATGLSTNQAIKLAYVDTPTSSWVKLRTAVGTAGLSNGQKIGHFYNFTVDNALIASLPLVPIYNSTLSNSSKHIYIEMSGISSKQVEVTLTQESGRTAIVSL